MIRIHTLVKTAAIMLAGVTTLGALGTIFFIAKSPEGGVLWVGGRLAAALFVLAMGMATAAMVRTAGARIREIVVLGAIMLVALGSAGTVFGFYMAETTGDLEAWAILLNLCIAAQGTALILWMWRACAPAQCT